MTLYVVLNFAAIGTEIALVGLLIRKSAYRAFPIFCAYLAWDIVDNVVLYATLRIHPAAYFLFYLAALTIDSVFMFAVLIELAWSVLRPFRSALPRGAIVVVALIMGSLFAAIWPFAHSAAFTHYGPQSRLLIHLQQTVSIMRILFFLVLVACSQLLSINWRDREMQIATGLGIYSLISVTVSILQAGQSVGATLNYLNQVAMASYVLSLAYLLISFAKKEVPRREFTPQMQSFLLAVAGAARSTRVSMTAPGTSQLHDRDK
ncbi:MAG TPA: hypothetical protein VGS10_03315 [Terracidiphilus sp.]|nr:hypothetical protein [Terracidiphilus sp.]